MRSDVPRTRFRSSLAPGPDPNRLGEFLPILEVGSGCSGSRKLSRVGARDSLPVTLRLATELETPALRAASRTPPFLPRPRHCARRGRSQTLGCADADDDVADHAKDHAFSSVCTVPRSTFSTISLGCICSATRRRVHGGKINRRVSNGDQVSRVAALAMKCGKRGFTGLLAEAY